MPVARTQRTTTPIPATRPPRTTNGPSTVTASAACPTQVPEVTGCAGAAGRHARRVPPPRKPPRITSAVLAISACSSHRPCRVAGRPLGKRTLTRPWTAIGTNPRLPSESPAVTSSPVCPRCSPSAPSPIPTIMTTWDAAAPASSQPKGRSGRQGQQERADQPVRQGGGQRLEQAVAQAGRQVRDRYQDGDAAGRAEHGDEQRGERPAGPRTRAGRCGKGDGSYAVDHAVRVPRRRNGRRSRWAGRSSRRGGIADSVRRFSRKPNLSAVHTGPHPRRVAMKAIRWAAVAGHRADVADEPADARSTRVPTTSRPGSPG